MTSVLTRTRLLLVSLLLVLILLPLHLAGAQEGQSITSVGNGFRISPVVSEFTIEPGGSEVLTITVENTSEAPINAVAVVNDFVASANEDGTAQLILDESESAPRNSFKTLTERPGNIPLGPREKRNIDVTIAVPENANVGGYYGSIRFVPEDANQPGNVGLTASVGTLVLVRVPGDLTERLDLVQLSAAQGDKLKSFLTGGDVSVFVRLKNSGDIHVKPFGKIVVKNMFGKVVHEYELNNTQPRANILPDSTRRFQDELPDQNWFGRYTIEANIGYSETGGGVISSKAAFWYLPAWFIIAMLVLVVGGTAATMTIVKRRKLRKLRHRPGKN